MMQKIKTVCLIDDDPIFVFGAKRLMKEAAFCDSILVYNNGQEGLEQLKILMKSTNLEEIPDIIFLDLNMPVMDGWEFLDRFAKINPPKSIVIYIVTSSISSYDKQRAEEYASAIKQYVIKPINPIKLKEIIDSYQSS